MSARTARAYGARLLAASRIADLLRSEGLRTSALLQMSPSGDFPQSARALRARRSARLALGGVGAAPRLRPTSRAGYGLRRSPSKVSTTPAPPGRGHASATSRSSDRENPGRTQRPPGRAREELLSGKTFSSPVRSLSGATRK